MKDDHTREVVAIWVNELSSVMEQMAESVTHLIYEMRSHHEPLIRYRSWLEKAIARAERDLDDAQWFTDGAYRHRAVKAARDELRALRRWEVRERGWHR